MKTLLTTFFLSFMVLTAANARPRTLQEKIQIAQKYISANTIESVKIKARAKTGASMELLSEYSDVSIVGYADGGFWVIANDDAFTPVMGYSDSPFSNINNPNFLWWLESVNENLSLLTANGEELVSITPSPVYSQMVDQLVTCQWDQGTPYNNMCPIYITASGATANFVTGCMATAMAQIMCYHKYPTTGTGSHSYFFTYDSNNPRIRASANFGQTIYEWDKMIDVYTNSRNGTPLNYTAEQADAVSTIMYHAGVAVDMEYTPDGSGAFANKACLALRNYFNFAPNIKMYSRDIYPIDEWMNIIYKELNDRCPVLYTGYSEREGGHAFVVDGYNESGLVHVNWGWSGSNDGWFNISAMKGFNQQQDLIIMRTPGDNRFNNKYFSIWGMISNLSIIRNGTNINVSTEGIYNFDVDNFTGLYGILAMNLSTGEVTTLYQSTINNVEYLYGVRLSLPNINVSVLANGEYRIYLGTKSNNEASWQPIRSSEHFNNSYILKRNGTLYELYEEKNSNWTATTAIYKPIDDVTKVIDNIWYTINGRRLNGDPNKHGVYIVNGKKVIK